jgi:hypothetical protein
MCFALRESSGLLQNVCEALDLNENFGTTFWLHSTIDSFSVEIGTNFL